MPMAMVENAHDDREIIHSCTCSRDMMWRSYKLRESGVLEKEGKHLGSVTVNEEAEVPDIFRFLVALLIDLIVVKFFGFNANQHFNAKGLLRGEPKAVLVSIATSRPAEVPGCYNTWHAKRERKSAAPCGLRQIAPAFGHTEPSPLVAARAS